MPLKSANNPGLKYRLSKDSGKTTTRVPAFVASKRASVWAILYLVGAITTSTDFIIFATGSGSCSPWYFLGNICKIKGSALFNITLVASSSAKFSVVESHRISTFSPGLTSPNVSIITRAPLIISAFFIRHHSKF